MSNNNWNFIFRVFSVSIQFYFWLFEIEFPGASHTNEEMCNLKSFNFWSNVLNFKGFQYFPLCNSTTKEICHPIWHCEYVYTPSETSQWHLKGFYFWENSSVLAYNLILYLGTFFLWKQYCDSEKPPEQTMRRIAIAMWENISPKIPIMP